VRAASLSISLALVPFILVRLNPNKKFLFPSVFSMTAEGSPDGGAWGEPKR
jgi:hypothetical protein